MANGLIPAARNGHYNVFDYLMYNFTDREVGAGDLVFEAFGEAIAHGHYHILQLIREEIFLLLSTYFITLLYRDFYQAAVSKAIAQGYADVVGFVVLNYPEDAGSMLEEAVAAGQHRFASEIRKAANITEDEDFE